MRRLFDENDNWTEEARALDRKAWAALEPIAKAMMASDASVRDIELVLLNCSSMLCSRLKIEAAIEARKAKENQ